jgi:adenylosuccinate synthase
LDKGTPVYEEMPGWTEDIRDARSLAELPRNTFRYVRRLEKLLGVPFSFVSVGPQREQTIVLESPFSA